MPVSKSSWWYGTSGTMNRTVVVAPVAATSICTGEMSVLLPIAERLSENGTTHNVRVDLSAIAMYGNKFSSPNLRSSLRWYPTAPIHARAFLGTRARVIPRLCMNRLCPSKLVVLSPECTSHGTLVFLANVATSSPENATRSK